MPKPTYPARVPVSLDCLASVRTLAAKLSGIKGERVSQAEAVDQAVESLLKSIEKKTDNK